MSAYQVDREKYEELAQLLQKMANIGHAGPVTHIDYNDEGEVVRMVHVKGLFTYVETDAVRHSVPGESLRGSNRTSSWAIATLLQAENAHSVAVRYKEAPQLVFPIRAESIKAVGSKPATQGDLAKLIRLMNKIEYQACEADDFNQSAAAMVINAMVKMAANHLAKMIAGEPE